MPRRRRSKSGSGIPFPFSLLAAIIVLPLRFQLVRRLLMFGAAIVVLLAVIGLIASSLSGGNNTVSGLVFVALVVLVASVSGLFWMQYAGRRRFRARSLGELLSMTPKGFEIAVANLLRDLGYRDVQLFGGAGDLSADIMCKDRKGRRMVVQCKRHAPGIKVGSPEVQSFIGMMSVHHKAERGMFVTTSEFTQPAASLGQQHSIELLDGKRLSAILETNARRRRSREQVADAARADSDRS